MIYIFRAWRMCLHRVAFCFLLLTLWAALMLPVQVARAQSPDATKTDEISDDNDSDNQADAGDTLQYTIIVTNSTGITFTTVVVSDTVDSNTTVVPGSLRITPVGINDSYAAIGNTQIIIPANAGLLVNDLDADDGGDNVAPWNTNLTVDSFDANSTNGGTVSANANGSFTYLPPVGFEGTDSFDYVVEDPHGLQDSGTVTIQVSEMVFYVNNSAAPVGDGRSTSPFDGLSDVTGAFGADEAGDIIFVYRTGTDYIGGIGLLDNQKLIGQGVDLATTAGLTPPLGTTLPTATTNPTLLNAGFAGVTLAQNNDLYGFTIGNSASYAILGSNFGTLDVGTVTINTTGPAFQLSDGAFGSGAAFTSVTSSGCGAYCLRFVNITGSVNLGTGASSGASAAIFAVQGGSVSTTYSGNLTQSGSGDLVSVIDGHTTGTLLFQSGTLQAGNGTGLQFDNADGIYTFNGTTFLNGGDAGVDITNGSAGTFTFSSNTNITSPSGAAFSMDSGTASVTYNGNIAQANNAALVSISGGHTSGTVTFQNGILSATGGTGLQFDNADSTYNFSGAVTLNGGDAGIDILNGSNSTLNFTNVSTAITNPSGAAFNLDASNANVTYSGSISDNSGFAVDINNHDSGTMTFQTGSIVSTGQGIRVQNSNGGSVSFNNLTKTLNTAGNAAVTLSSNGGSTINFSNGGLDIDTTTGAGFSATGGGTVNVAGANNTIDSTSATALNVSATTIGASNLNFVSISSGNNTAAVDPTNGIVLNNTGSSGGLTVSGNSSGLCGGQVTSNGATVTTPNAADCTGGVIQNTTGAGILLTSVSDISLTRIRVANSADDGISGSGVADLTLTANLIENNGNAVGDRGIDIANLTGSGGISTSTIRGSKEHNIIIQNSTATALTAFNVTNSQIATNDLTPSTGTGDDGIQLLSNGSGSMVVSVTQSAFTDNKGDHFQAASSASSTGSINATFNNNTLLTTTANDPQVVGGGITINPGNQADIIFTISGNNIQQAFDDAININHDPSSTAASNLQGTINGNTIGTAGEVDSGSESSNTITVAGKGAGTNTIAVTNNTVHQWANGHGIVATISEGTASMDVTITGNTVKNHGAFGINGIQVMAGATGGDNGTLCVALTGNDTTDAGNDTTFDTDIRLRQRFTTTIRLPGYGGANNNLTAVNDFVAANNDPVGATLAPSVSSVENVAGGGGGFVGGVACATP